MLSDKINYIFINIFQSSLICRYGELGAEHLLYPKRWDTQLLRWLDPNDGWSSSESQDVGRGSMFVSRPQLLLLLVPTSSRPPWGTPCSCSWRTCSQCRCTSRPSRTRSLKETEEVFTLLLQQICWTDGVISLNLFSLELHSNIDTTNEKCHVPKFKYTLLLYVHQGRLGGSG